MNVQSGDSGRTSETLRVRARLGATVLVVIDGCSDAMSAYADSVNDRFSYLFEPRQGKPRSSGLTFVIGDALAPGGPDALADLLAFGGAWIDWYKLVYSSLPLQPPSVLAEKLELLADHDVEAFPGGNFLEVAVQQGVSDRFLEDVRDVGCPRVEVSATVIDLDRTVKTELIERAVEMGFDVHSEVGKKRSEGGDGLSMDAVIEAVEADLAAGADAVIYESEAVEDVLQSGAESSTGDALDAVDALVDAVGLENLVFELPLTTEYRVTEVSAAFVNRFGADVNLGNVVPHHVNLIEQQRRGIGPGTYAGEGE